MITAALCLFIGSQLAVGDLNVKANIISWSSWPWQVHNYNSWWKQEFISEYKTKRGLKQDLRMDAITFMSFSVSRAAESLKWLAESNRDSPWTHDPSHRVMLFCWHDHCKSIRTKSWAITFILWWNISILMGSLPGWQLLSAGSKELFMVSLSWPSWCSYNIMLLLLHSHRYIWRIMRLWCHCSLATIPKHSLPCFTKIFMY